MTAAPRCQDAPLPPADGLTWNQCAGRTCCICGKPLTADAVYRGMVDVRDGGYLLNVNVWVCSDMVAAR